MLAAAACSWPRKVNKWLLYQLGFFSVRRRNKCIPLFTYAAFLAIRSTAKRPSMQEQQNIDLVKKLYGAFSKKDIDTIIDHLAGQLDWRFDAPSLIPYAGEHDTPDKVRERFPGR